MHNFYTVLQTHPYVRLLIKIMLGAIAVTLAFQSQLYARWLQFVGAAVAGCAVAVYGLSKNSLDPSGDTCTCKDIFLAAELCVHACWNCIQVQNACSLGCLDALNQSTAWFHLSTLHTTTSLRCEFKDSTLFLHITLLPSQRLTQAGCSLNPFAIRRHRKCPVCGFSAP